MSCIVASGIPRLHIFVSWEFPDLIYSQCGNSQTTYILRLGIPRLHIFLSWEIPDPIYFTVGNSQTLYIVMLGIPRPHVFLSWEIPDHIFHGWEFPDCIYCHINSQTIYSQVGNSQTLYIVMSGIPRPCVFSCWAFPDLLLSIPRPHILMSGIPMSHIAKSPLIFLSS